MVSPKAGAQMKRDRDNEERSVVELLLLANPQFAGERIASVSWQDGTIRLICAGTVHRGRDKVFAADL